MFKRILHDDWTSVVPIIAFALTFTFFVVMIVRSMRMKKSVREHLSSLPLDDDQPSN
jgi:hypothetical protein